MDMTDDEKKIHDDAWDGLTEVAEKFKNASPESEPASLVFLMIQFATVLALSTCPDTKTAYNLIAEAINVARERN